MTADKKKEFSQLDRFVETARALACDEDKERFEAMLGKVAAHKARAVTGPVESKSTKPRKKQDDGAAK